MRRRASTTLIAAVCAASQPSCSSFVHYDAGSDLDVVDASDVVPPSVPAPRQIAPLSGSIVTTHTPTFRWSLAANSDGAIVEVCATRSCASIEQSITASGVATATSTTPLNSGVHFWRLRGTAGARVGSAIGPTWEFFVGRQTVDHPSQWGSLMDLDGDGHVDIVVGASDQAFVFRGSSIGTESLPSFTLPPPVSGAAFPGQPACAGDVNGDGFSDLVAAAYTFMGGNGRAYVYLGSATGIAPTVPINVPAPASAWFGQTAGAAGDVDGDGYADLAVGGPVYMSRAGAVWIFRGGPTGVGSDPAYMFTGADGPTANFGGSVVGGLDVNADGRPDIIIGEPGIWDAVANTPVAGAVFAYFGGPSGFSSTPSVALRPPSAAGTASFGYSLSGAGDLNGDGVIDIVIGAPTAAGLAGAAYVYYGMAGFGASMVEIPAPEGGQFGFAVVGPGDVDGDGIDDLVVGARKVSNDSGRVYLFRGGRGGVATTPATTSTPPDSGGRFGTSISTAGDQTGDGFADIVVGSPGSDGEAGRVYIVTGSPTGLQSGPAFAWSRTALVAGHFGQLVAGQ